MSKRTPVPTQSCLDLALEMAHGPELFNKEGKPSESLERYTGSRVTQNLERCLMAGALRLLEASDRQIADTLGCDVRSIPLMLTEAEHSGRIPALKDRLAALTGRNAERAQIALRVMLDEAAQGKASLELAAMVKALATAGGIATQNLQLLTGSPTEILEVRTGAGREEIEAWARLAAVPIEAEVMPNDLESAAKGGKGQQNGGSAALGYTGDTTPRPGDGPVAAAPGGTSGPAADPAAGGGGGDGARDAGQKSDGSIPI